MWESFMEEWTDYILTFLKEKEKKKKKKNIAHQKLVQFPALESYIWAFRI